MLPSMPNIIFILLMSKVEDEYDEDGEKKGENRSN